MLPHIIPQARIWVYEYNSKCYSDHAPEVDILGLGEQFLESMWIEKAKGIGKRPLVFVGSCFGGVVVAQVRLTKPENGCVYVASHLIVLTFVGPRESRSRSHQQTY